MNFQQQARHLLEKNHTPPQRYGTAFHIRPPVPDVRQLALPEPVILSTNQWKTLPSDIQNGILSRVQHDPYALWCLAHQAHFPVHVVVITTEEQQKIRLSGSGLWFIHVEPGAELQIEDILSDQKTAIRRTYIWQERDSKVKSIAVRVNNEFLTEKYEIFLKGPHAHTTVTHLTYGKENHQADIEVNTYHQAPATESNLKVRSVAEKQSVTIYRGLIDIAQDAQGSKGYQQGKGLYSGQRAVIDMLPELQIKTNDVQCSHGVTTTYIDERVLFYARSRGLTEPQARAMFITGFYHQGILVAQEVSKILKKHYA